MLYGDLDSSFTHAGFFITASNSVIRGLAIGLFEDAILLEGASGVAIKGCFLGTDAPGLAAQDDTRGVSAIGANNVVIGGTDPADRNVISSNATAGIDLESCDGAEVQGNLIGTNAEGTAALGNGQGIYAASSAAVSVTIGGPATGAGNVISGNGLNGVTLALAAGSAVLVQGNVLGVRPDLSLPLPNTFAGIRISTSGALIGGIGTGEGNVIANNGTAGVDVDNNTFDVTIRGNSIVANQGLGIDRGFAGVTPNDQGDADGVTNYPMISLAEPVSGGVHIKGALRAHSLSTYDLDFYANGTCLDAPGEYLQGKSFLGTVTVMTDVDGTAVFDVTIPGTILFDEYVSATATNSVGDTSEFSQRAVLVVNPNSGPAAGGTPVSLYGSDFMPDALLEIDGVPATNVTVTSFNSLTATVPPLTPGTLADVTVTNTDGTTSTFQGGYVVDFTDVPASHPFYPFVTTVFFNRITAGVGGGNYGVNLPILRQQMPVFLLKAKHGLCYTPPPCSGMFADVSCPSNNFAPWIEAAAAEGITGGCGGGNYCPMSPVRRDQMAPFLLKTKYGSSYVPPACVGIFPDVSCSSQFAPWIEELYNEQITGGCGGGNYCPSADNTRGQMAVFVIKTFF